MGLHHRITVDDIFVPGGIPEHTYIARERHKLESRLQMALSRGVNKLIVVTGMTKSGKTVLVNRVFPRNKAIWVDGGVASSEEEFWQSILLQMEGYTGVERTASRQSTYEISGGLEGEGGVSWFARLKGLLASRFQRSRLDAQSKVLEVSPKVAALKLLRDKRHPLVIDDFHYIDRTLQGKIIRALKPLILQGSPVVLIAIPHRRYDAVKVEREMTGRIENLPIPAWDIDELTEIPRKGFSLLGVSISDEVSERLAQEAFGSPHLMQEFCLRLAQRLGIEQTDHQSQPITQLPQDLFVDVAEGTGRVVFEKLARGPRQRSDRKQRKLVSGGEADIYRVVLLAIAHLKPGLGTIEYEELRSALRTILDENIPRANEVTRVLEKMSEIAASDEASTPVIDWERDERRLHITDPFFAFYLKWARDF